MYCVYRHTSPSGKVYIGISKSVNRRWEGNGKKYLRKEKTGKYTHWLFAPAIIKYGWENFKHEIIYDNLNEISAKLIEEDLIYYYKKKKLSYNVADSSFNCKYINNRISIIQLSTSLEIIAEFKSAADAGLALSVANTNITKAIKNKHQCKGFYWIYKSELSDLQKIVFKPIADYTIYQLDPLTKTVINKFSSISDAANKYNVVKDAIGNAIKRKTKSVGYYWIKAKDINDISNIKWKRTKEDCLEQGVAITLENIITGEIKNFKSKQAACRYLGYSTQSSLRKNPNNIRGWRII